jgi:hypothetical protein
VVESSALLKRRTPKGYRGFESLPHRQLSGPRITERSFWPCSFEPGDSNAVRLAGRVTRRGQNPAFAGSFQRAKAPLWVIPPSPPPTENGRGAACFPGPAAPVLARALAQEWAWGMGALLPPFPSFPSFSWISWSRLPSPPSHGAEEGSPFAVASGSLPGSLFAIPRHNQPLPTQNRRWPKQRTNGDPYENPLPERESDSVRVGKHNRISPVFFAPSGPNVWG